LVKNMHTLPIYIITLVLLMHFKIIKKMLFDVIKRHRQFIETLLPANCLDIANVMSNI
jgi:hypothetical protein